MKYISDTAIRLLSMNDTSPSPQTSSAGGDGRMTIAIGVALVVIGVCGFIILKIREKQKT